MLYPGRVIANTFTYLLLAAGLTSVAWGSERIEMRRGLIWINAISQVAGQNHSLNLIVDTGAEETVLDLRTAKEMGLEARSAESIRGVGGISTAYRSETGLVQCAGVGLRQSFLLVDLSDASQQAGRHIDGLLGADFFHGRVVQIDYRSRHLMVSPSSSRSSGSQVLPISRHYGAFCVPVTVDGCTLSKVRVDTGCVSALHWSHPGAGASSVRSGSSIGFSGNARRDDRNEVTLGGLVLERVKTAYHAQRIFPGEDGLLGNGLLEQFRVTIDLRRNQLVLSPY